MIGHKLAIIASVLAGRHSLPDRQQDPTINMKKFAVSLALLAGTALAIPAALSAQDAPANLLPDEQELREDGPEADDAVSSSMSGPVEMVREPVVQQFDPVVQQWTRR